LVGVTGTSGKTTTTYVLASIFEAAGLPAGIIGTIGTFSRSQKLAAGLTTPESVDIESALAAMESEGVRSVAAEVSSIGIAEGRVDWLNFRAAIFTNFGRDHLDYHRTSEEYFAAKLRLFSEILPRSKRSDAFAVVNASDPYGRRILEATSVRKFTFGSDNSSDAFAESIDADLSGIRARVSVLGKRIDIESPMVGEFNLMNILAASTAGVAMGIDAQAVAEGVRRCPGAPGRMEAVAAKAGVSVIVDYAHKPDALEAVLSALHRLAPGRLICVFGCGGDRDRGKRPIMGGIAARLADLTIITSDNPRSEDPIEIIREIERGAIEAGARTVRAGAAIPDTRVFIVEPDRRAAIYRALSIAQPGDAVVIAGKGHEDYQIVGSRIAAFDDRSVAREIGAGMRWQNR
jgi:UDP-N-acetylmuramoyl-L-alanyl-D-glutamate--2,6-diaminopimelate ligase